MKMNLKTLVGAAAIAGALGFPTIGVGAGVANAATPAPSIPGPVHTVQAPADLGPARAQPVDDWHGGDWGWGGRGDGGRGGWGDRGGWGWGGWGGWGWGDRGGWGWGDRGGWGWGC
jgi:hypothetical protein